MSRWTDVQLLTQDVGEAMDVIAERFKPATVSVDFSRQQWGEGVTLRVQDQLENDVIAALDHAGIRPLSVTTRLDAAMRDDATLPELGGAA